MTRFFVLLWMVAGLFGGSAQAVEPPWNGPTAVQVYREAGDAPVDTGPPMPAPSAPAEPTSAAPSPAYPAQQDQSSPRLDRVELLEAKLESVNTKIDELNAHEIMLQAQIKQLEHALLLLNRHFNALQAGQTPPSSTLAAAVAGVPLDFVLYAFVAAGALVIVGGVIGLILWLRRRRRTAMARLKKATAHNAQQDDGPEYDYMGSQESIPVKLNLARAYIAMEDFQSAKTVIAEILRTGNTEQREEAKQLNTAIPISQQ